VGVFGSEPTGLEPLNGSIERFLASLRFEQRDKLAHLAIDLRDVV
jgi:hypothetical protein